MEQAARGAQISKLINQAISKSELLAAIDWSEGMYGLARAGIGFAAIFLLVAIAVAVVRKYQRDGALWTRLSGSNAGDWQDPSELLTKFREMHSRGTLSDAEYRTIKLKLASQIESELNPSGPSSDS